MPRRQLDNEGIKWKVKEDMEEAEKLNEFFAKSLTRCS